MTADDYFTTPQDVEYDPEQAAEDYEDYCNWQYDRLQDYLITK